MTTTRPNPKLASTSSPGTATKSKRVRTGCLTCRERHLKCDESLPNCINCRKGNRPCKRGIRLNFLDTHVHVPPYAPRSCSWDVKFQDESRHIASEYRGGLRRYAPMEKNVERKCRVKQEAHLERKGAYRCAVLSESPPEQQTRFATDDSPVAGAMSSPSSIAKSYPESRLSSPNQVRTVGWTDSTEDSNYVFPNPAVYSQYLAWQYENPPQPGKPKPARRAGQQQQDFFARTSKAMQDGSKPARCMSARDDRGGYKQAAAAEEEEEEEEEKEEEEDDATLMMMSKPATGEREFLRTADEVRYMQVFVEEVASWMDSFDKEKHFGHYIPYRALKSPMLLNSLLACGVRHLSMRDADKMHTAQFYYNTATTQLLRNLENPERDTTECAAAAVMLKVCELMSRKSSRRMSHVFSARALMSRDCGWDASSTGVGAACFWLNIYLEVLRSLESDCAMSWPPDEWGLDLGWITEEAGGGVDEDGRVGEEEVWIQRMIYILAKVAEFQAFVSVFVGDDLSGEKMRLEYRLPEWRSLKHLCDRWNDRCPRTMHPLGYLDPGQTSCASLFPQVWLPRREAGLGRLLYHTAQCILTQTNPMQQAVVSEEMQALQIHHAHEVCGIVAHTREDSGLAFLTAQSLVTASRILVDDGERGEVLRLLRGMHAESGWFSEDAERGLKVSWNWEAAEEETGQEGVMAQFSSFAARPPYQGWYEPPSQPSSVSPSMYSSFQ